MVRAIGSGWTALVAGTDSGYLELMPAMITGGVGLTMAMPAAQRGGGRRGPATAERQASGAFMMPRIFGGVFGVAVLVALALGMPGRRPVVLTTPPP